MYEVIQDTSILCKYVDIQKFLCLNFVESRPTGKYLQRLCVERYALHWRKIGLELNLSIDILNIIEAKNRADHVNCCQDMLQKWLERDPEATWKRLFEAENIAFSLKSRSKDA